MKLRINTEGKIKLFLSLSLFFYSIVVSLATNNYIICVAMCLSSIGDILLLANRGCLTEKKKETFLYGIVAFSLSHLLYMCAMNVSFLSKVLICIAFGLIVILSVFVMGKGESKITAFSIYGVILLLNVFNSLNFSLIAGIGMILFTISDLIIAVCKIRKNRTLVSQFLIWITYVLAQIYLLTSFLLQ